LKKGLKMLIHEVARNTGLPKDTIRYYTKLGLIHAEERSAGSRIYAEYEESVIELLSEIKLAKSAGFTLNEIKTSLSEWKEGNLSNEAVAKIFQTKLKEVRQKKKELIKIENLLKSKIELCSKK